MEPVWHVVDGFVDAQNGQDMSTEQAINVAAATTGVIVERVASASLAGAGSLAGYAGMASAVSSVGLGGATTAIAGALGSNVAGAAATAVVTSAVGGPVVMGGILAVGAGAAVYSLYQVGHWAGKQIQLW